MEPLITIPREALAELLKTSGSTLSPEEYVASLSHAGAAYAKYASRAKAAVWSKSILLIAAIFSVAWVCTPLGFGLEDMIIAIGLVTVTFFEFRVHRYFRESNPRAPTLGFRNQTAFAAALLIYGLYHAIAPLMVPLPVEYNNLIDPDTMDLIHRLTRVFYLVIGAVGGISQFCLAWYYRNAQAPA